MKTNLKDNIWIEGFNDITIWNAKLCYLGSIEEDKIIWHGKTSEIPEELARECVFIRDSEYIPNVGTYKGGYKDYTCEEPFEYYFETAKDSILSACPQEYCIIYKLNNEQNTENN